MSNCGCENKREIFPDCDMSRWEVQCSSYIEDADNYYTKKEVDDLIEGASGCCITPEEVDEKIDEAVSGKQDTLIAGDNIIISGNVISSSGCDLTNYYTTAQTVNLIESAVTIVEAEIPSLSGYATEQWVENKHYLTEHQPLKTINGQVISGSGNIEIECESGITSGEVQTMIDNSISGKQDTLIAGDNITIVDNVISATGGGSGVTSGEVQTMIDNSLSGYTTEQWVINQNYITNSEFVQYITNLQNQIDSLKAQISGCCGTTGETLYRWVTMIGENDYWCDGTTKKALEKKQSSSDGINWTDVVPNEIRSGSTVLQYESTDCGYDIGGMKITLNDNTTIDIDCEDVPSYPCSGSVIHCLEHSFIMSAVTSVTSVTAVKRIDIGTCVDVLLADAFSGFTSLQKVVIPSTFKGVRGSVCDGIDVNAFESTAIRTVGMEGSNADIIWNDNMTHMASLMFKGCTALTSVELHSNFGTFDPQVFSGCTNLQSITLHSTTLPMLNTWAQGGYQYDGLDGIGNNTFVIYVPSNMVDTYKNAVDHTGYYNWSKYASHIQPIPNS